MAQANLKAKPGVGRSTPFIRLMFVGLIKSGAISLVVRLTPHPAIRHAGLFGNRIPGGTQIVRAPRNPVKLVGEAAVTSVRLRRQNLLPSPIVKRISGDLID
jgi:hypothetical protein